ncbi:MAG: DUF1365 domain-containing protein [Gammaproteobacteria bacterium]
MNSRLYLGTVMHQRQDRNAYRFVYKVFNLLLDVDELPELSRRLRFFSHNRFNLFSLSDRDHGARDGTPLRAWAERELQARGIDLEGGRIRLLCFPRVLGYVFNPLSVWYCEHRDGSLRAVICEVRNTFGGMHHYFLCRGGGAPMDWRAEYSASKVFHVSPFLSQDMEYQFRFLAPDERIGVYIDEYAIQGCIAREPAQAGSAGERPEPRARLQDVGAGFSAEQDAEQKMSPGLYRTHRVVKPQDRVLQKNGATPLAEREHVFKACISARSVALTDDRLIGVFCGMPLLPLKVIAAIHWQALKLWLRGARFHRMPEHGIYPERIMRSR